MARFIVRATDSARVLSKNVPEFLREIEVAQTGGATRALGLGLACGQRRSAAKIFPNPSGRSFSTLPGSDAGMYTTQ